MKKKKKKKRERPGLSRVYPDRLGSGSTGFFRANFQAGFYLDPDRSQARVGRVPGRPAGPVRVSKLWIIVPKLGIFRKIKREVFFLFNIINI
jgi:hypothetical protein